MIQLTIEASRCRERRCERLIEIEANISALRPPAAAAAAMDAVTNDLAPSSDSSFIYRITAALTGGVTSQPTTHSGAASTWIFSARQHAERAICYRKSVCLSVCHTGGSVENGCS